MAKTSFSTSNALTKKAWEEKVLRETRKEAYFDKFMGEDMDSLVYVKTNLEKDYGDRITFGLIKRLTGAGVTSGTPLEGNEEALGSNDYSLSLEQYRHAVRDDGEMSRQRAAFSISAESQAAIRSWGAEKIDTLCFAALEASPTQIAYPSGAGGTPSYTTVEATAKAALHATGSLLTLNFISWCKGLAKTGHNRDFDPIRPVKVNGRAYLILLVPPDVMYDLRTNSGFQQAQREAEIRGPENPLFQGATAIWDGLVIHEHEEVTVATDGGGAAVPWARCTLMGAQALCWAWGKRPEFVQRDFDYGNEVGHAFSMLAGVGKPVFNSRNYGSLSVFVARTRVTDA